MRADGNHGHSGGRHGHQVTVLREVLPIRSLDPVVIAKAQELGAILVSLSGDFADIVTYTNSDHGIDGEIEFKA